MAGGSLQVPQMGVQGRKEVGEGPEGGEALAAFVAADHGRGEPGSLGEVALREAALLANAAECRPHLLQVEAGAAEAFRAEHHVAFNLHALPPLPGPPPQAVAHPARCCPGLYEAIAAVGA